MNYFNMTELFLIKIDHNIVYVRFVRMMIFATATLQFHDAPIEPQAFAFVKIGLMDKN